MFIFNKQQILLCIKKKSAETHYSFVSAIFAFLFVVVVAKHKQNEL